MFAFSACVCIFYLQIVAPGRRALLFNFVRAKFVRVCVSSGRGMLLLGNGTFTFTRSRRYVTCVPGVNYGPEGTRLELSNHGCNCLRESGKVLLFQNLLT